MVVTRSLVPLAAGFQHDVREAVQSPSWSRELLEQVFDDGKLCVQMRNLPVLFLIDSKFLSPHLCLLDQFVTDPAATVICATGHQIVSLFRSVCEEVKGQLLSPLMNSYIFLASIWFNSFGIWCTIYVFLLTELKDVVDRLKQGPSKNSQRIGTTETSADETEASKRRRRGLSKRTLRMKNVYGVGELGRFFVTRQQTLPINKVIFTVRCAGQNFMS